MPIYMKLQAEFGELESIARMLTAEAEEIEQMLSKLAQGVQYLEGGAWEGQAANAFYGDMREVVLPGMRKLSTRLEDVSSLVQQVSKHFQDADQQAGNLFKHDGAMKFGGEFHFSSGGDMKFSTDSFSFGDGSVHKFGDGSLKIMPAGEMKFGDAMNADHKFGDGSLKIMPGEGGNVGDQGLKLFGPDNKFASGGGGGAGDSAMKYGDSSMAKFSDANITDGSSMKFESGGGGAGDMAKFASGGGGGAGDMAKFASGGGGGAGDMAKFASGGGGGAGTNAAKFEGIEVNGDG